ncbi:MAG: segregation/condensation protein A [Candidatus Omnitrophica bacterium]|nr:segregation/condensation protein A [Candidatus Omnitrophota bacterium]
MSYKVKLEIFEGPLDLLLHLVKQNHLEIAQIPIAQITDQYLKYLELMQALDLEIAGEFLVMAATLMQIKSRMLLPPEVLTPEEAEEPDPTQELIQRLLEYQRFKQAAELLSTMEKNRFVQLSRPAAPDGAAAAETEELKEASLFDLLNAFSLFMKGQVSRELFHEVIKDEFTVEEKTEILRNLIQDRGKLGFSDLFGAAKNTLEIIATFLALLELIRLKEIVVRQAQHFGEILILRNTDELKTTA